MLKPTNSNGWYIGGLVPLFLCALAQILVIVRPIHQWIFYSVLLVGFWAIYALVKKAAHLPRPLSEYTDLQALSLSLPIECFAEFFTCKALSKHAFIVRIVEVLSPLCSKKTEPATIILNPEFIGEKNRAFLTIAVCHEIVRCQTKTQVRIILRLFVPLLILANIILAIFVLKLQYSFITGLWFDFFVPVGLAAAFVTHLALWNNSLSKHEQRLDRYLLTLFSIEAVEAYIMRLEELQGADEKEKYRSVNKFYAEQRIRKLRN